MDRDAEHLKLLSIFYYVAAGLSLFGTCCGGFYAIFGLLMSSNSPAFQTHGQPPPPAFVGGIMVVLGAVIICMSLVLSVVLFFSGRCLTRRKAYTFCLIVAGFICLSVPLGTTLGVFTFIVLLRPSVKALFETERLGGSLPPPLP